MPAPSPKAKITVIINGKDYQLSADNPEAVSQLPKAERNELLRLLNAIQQQQSRSQQTQEHALRAVTARPSKAPRLHSAQEQASLGLKQAGKLGRGDADALMARLIQEESRDRKPGLSKQGIYKFVGISALAVFLLVIIF